jgi:hypothetical protein
MRHLIYRHYRRLRIFLAIVWRPDDVSRVSVRTAPESAQESIGAGSPD